MPATAHQHGKSERGEPAAALPGKLAFIGYGEAAAAFAEGWGASRGFVVSAYDLKTDHPDAAVRAAKRADYERAGIEGGTLAQALAGAEAVISVVTADQAETAAQAASGHIAPGTLYLDFNSASPGTKRACEAAIEAAGARYVDVAVMSPVRPALHRTPLLLAGPHGEAGLAWLTALGMKAEIAGGQTGQAAAIKMIRSIMIKGLEALSAECVLTAVQAGVDGPVLDSLESSFPGFGWRERTAYMLERMTTHGVRRAVEMHEVARTADEFGVDGLMSRAAAARQDELGWLGLKLGGCTYEEAARAILAARKEAVR